MSVVDVARVDLSGPAVLRVELVVKVDPASVTTNSETVRDLLDQLGTIKNTSNNSQQEAAAPVQTSV